MKRRNRRAPVVFYITYDGLLGALGASQVLPYLERMLGDWSVHIVSFEHPPIDQNARAALERRLADRGIGWTALRYHKTPSLLASSYDLLNGAIELRRLATRRSPALIHTRGYIPTAIALRSGLDAPLLFDIRGLLPEEYVDGGVWKKGELKYRLAKRSERRFFARADGAVVLTHAIKPYARERFADYGRSPPIEVVPCCVDLNRFVFDPDQRSIRRKVLGVNSDCIVLTYSGSLGTWYLPNEMARFAAGVRRTTGRSIHLLWLVNNGKDLAAEASRAAGLAPADFTITSSPSAEMPSWLAASDVGLAMVRPSFSKRASSPTKYAEFLAMGLPLVLCKDVGDSQRIVDHGGAVALSAQFDAAEGERTAGELLELMANPRAQFRSVAATLFDIETVGAPTYRRLYDQLAR